MTPNHPASKFIKGNIELPGINLDELGSTAPFALHDRVKVVRPGIYCSDVVNCVGTVTYTKIGGYGVSLDDSYFGPSVLWFVASDLEKLSA